MRAAAPLAFCLALVESGSRPKVGASRWGRTIDSGHGSASGECSRRLCQKQPGPPLLLDATLLVRVVPTMAFRWAASIGELREMAADLVRLNVDLIFATSSTEVEAARQATTTIPIVFATHADPVGIKHVASLARPGGNITGLTMVLTEITTKQLEILKEALPHASRMGVLWSPAMASHALVLQAIQTTAVKL